MTAATVDDRTLLPGPTWPPSAPPTSLALADRRPVALADDPCEAGFSGAGPEYAGIYLHARYFDPKLGTFLSADPSDPTLPGVGTNRFSYAFGNPVNGTDRSGLYVHCTDQVNEHGLQECFWIDMDTVLEVGIGVPPIGVPFPIWLFGVNPILAEPAPAQEPATGTNNTGNTGTGSGTVPCTGPACPAPTPASTGSTAPAPIAPPPPRKLGLTLVKSLTLEWAGDLLAWGATNMDCGGPRQAVHGLAAAAYGIGAFEGMSYAIGGGIAAFGATPVIGPVPGSLAVGGGIYLAQRGIDNAQGQLLQAKREAGACSP